MSNRSTHPCEVPMYEFQLANVTIELAGKTRTNSCDLNLGIWIIELADEWGTPRLSTGSFRLRLMGERIKSSESLRAQMRSLGSRRPVATSIGRKRAKRSGWRRETR